MSVADGNGGIDLDQFHPLGSAPVFEAFSPIAHKYPIETRNLGWPLKGNYRQPNSSMR